MIRAATPADLGAIAAIYAHYVEHTAITFDFAPPPAATWERRLAAAAGRGHPWLVAEASGAVAGYASAGPFRDRPAYDRTAETSIYLRHDAGGRGLGRALYAALLDELTTRGFHLAVAGMTLPNPASRGLHRALGFEAVGTFDGVGHKFGRWWDVEFLQLRLAPASGSAPSKVPSAP